MSGFLRLYSYEENGTIVVSSSMLAVLSTINKPEFDRRKLGGFIAGHYGRETVFIKGINMLDPLKYLVVDKDSGYQGIKRDIPEVKRLETLESAKEYVKALFKEQVDAIKPALGEKKVNMDATGGLDSRLVTSVLKTAGINFDYINYPIFGPDAEIAKILSDGLGKKLYVQTNIPTTENLEKHYGEFDFGHNYFRQYPNPRWIKDNDFEFSGSRGECIDLPDIYSDEDLSYMKDTKPEVLISKLTPDPLMTDSNREEYESVSYRLYERKMWF